VVDRRLGESAWLAGDDYSIADIATFPWITNLIGFYGAGELVGIDDFANVKRVLAAFLERPAVVRGLGIPARPAPPDRRTPSPAAGAGRGGPPGHEACRAAHGPARSRRSPHRHLRLALRARGAACSIPRPGAASRARVRVADAADDRDQRLVLSLQRPESYAEWHDATPDDFVFALKGSRYITHMLKLNGAEVPLANFFASGVLRLRRQARADPVAVPAAARLRRGALRRLLRPAAARHDGALALARRHDARSPAAPGCDRRERGRCAMRSRSAIRASSTRRSSRCCAGTASPSSSPTPPGAGRCSRT
jgi:hypothetical protein